MTDFINTFSGAKFKFVVVTGLTAFYLTACGAVGNFVKLPESDANRPATNVVAANTPAPVKIVPGSSSPDKNDPVKTTGEITDLTWNQMPSMFQKIGEQAVYRCSPNGTRNPNVYGTDVYDVNSSVCNAAVHAGLITFKDGGTVIVEMRPGLSSYVGSERNGVETMRVNQTTPDRSFVFVKSGGTQAQRKENAGDKSDDKADGDAQRIEFKSGQNSIALKGNLKRNGSADESRNYVFRARANQKATIEAITSQGETASVTFSLYSPGGASVTGEDVSYDEETGATARWSGTLPQSGNYELRVYLDGNMKSNSFYTLKLTLE